MNTPHLLVGNIFFAPYTYGGATIVAEEVARSLQARHGWHVSVLSAVSRTDLPEYAIRKLQSDGIANYVINLPPSRRYAEMYSNAQVSEAASRLIQTLDPDLVHLHCIQELGTGIIQAARQAKLPVVVSAHDFWWICERQFMIRQDGRYCGQSPVEVGACRSCVMDITQTRTRFLHLQDNAAEIDLMTYPSEFARALCDQSGIRPRDQVVWQNGVTLPQSDFADRQARRRAADPRLVFGYCGGPSDIKGWPLIERAFGGLKRSDFRVRLADGSVFGSWWKETDLAALPGDWSVHPRYSQSQMDDFWCEVDVLLFPSQWKETFGLTIREALARGVRVIQTDSGGTTEHLGPDRTRMLKIGDGHDRLREELMFALDRPDPYSSPLEIADFDAQADRFVTLTAPLLARSSAAKAAQIVAMPKGKDSRTKTARHAAEGGTIHSLHRSQT
ncbi:glycosyltransferase [Pseudooceanicola sediminis]|nr:glycosyltransferase [Pseudooceanicola sediminis]|tara:strand:- start:8791 stop:10125 length:1335 start_codon:yes stop_codon:yes gene_type:complete